MQTTEQMAETKNGIAEDEEKAPESERTSSDDADGDEGNAPSIEELIKLSRAADDLAAEKKKLVIKVIREEINLHENAARCLRDQLATYGEADTERPPPLASLAKPSAVERARAYRSRPTAPRKPGIAKAKARSTGRLPRRTNEQIAAGVVKIVGVVKKAGAKGTRAEAIRDALGLDVREMPKLLKTALQGKEIRAKGKARARTYYAR